MSHASTIMPYEDLELVLQRRQDTNTTTTTSSSSTTSTTSTTSDTSSSSSTSDTSSTSDATSSTNSNTSDSSSSSTTQTLSTVVSTTIITTQADGSTVTITSSSTQLTTSSGIASNSGGSSGSSSHVGAIAGGVVGGVAALILLILLSWCIARRRKKNEFDGDFDPDNVGAFKHGRQNLAPDGPTGAEVTPFTMNDGATVPQMGEHHANPVGLAAGGGMAGLGAGMLGAAAMDGRAQSGGSPRSESEYQQTESSYLPNPYGPGYNRGGEVHPEQAQSLEGSSVYSRPSQPRSAKEREALVQRYGNSVNTNYSSGSSARPLVLASPSDTDASSHVVVHQDGGRVREEEMSGAEIPPTYDSIPADERPRA